MENYKNWMKDHLFARISSSMSIIELNNNERGIFTSQSLENHTILLTIPFNSLLSINSIISENIEIFQSILTLWREDDILAILLLYEKYFKKENSKWFVHIQYLPSNYHSIINFTDEELKEIKGSNLYDLTINWKAQIQSDFYLIYQNCYELFQLIGGCSWLTYETYLWALCTIWSRFVTVNKNNTSYRCMVPFFDMLNHSNFSSVGHFYDETSDCLNLTTITSLSQSNEITLSYGKLSNTKLMMLYGFTLLENPYNSIELFINLPKEGEENQFKNDLLELWKINHQKPFIIELSNENYCGIPKELIYCLRVQYGDWGIDDDDDDELEEEEEEEEENDWTESERELLLRYINSNNNDNSLETNEDNQKQRRIKINKRKELRYKTLLKGRKGSITLGNEMIISQILLQSLSNMLNSYSTTIQEDEILLNEIKNTIRSESVILHHDNNDDNSIDTVMNPIEMIYPSERVKNSIIMRYSEKVILQSAINWISCHMTDLTPFVT